MSKNLFRRNVKVEDKAVVTGNARVQNARKEIIREENEKAQTELFCNSVTSWEINVIVNIETR